MSFIIKMTFNTITNHYNSKIIAQEDILVNILKIYTNILKKKKLVKITATAIS